MEVPWELQIRLSSLAERTGRDAQRLLHEAIEQYAENEERFMRSVEEGIASADKGDLIEDEEALAWLEERERS